MVKFVASVGDVVVVAESVVVVVATGDVVAFAQLILVTDTLFVRAPIPRAAALELPTPTGIDIIQLSLSLIQFRILVCSRAQIDLDTAAVLQLTIELTASL